MYQKCAQISAPDAGANSHFTLLLAIISSTSKKYTRTAQGFINQMNVWLQVNPIQNTSWI
jgi:hypothetical protein